MMEIVMRNIDELKPFAKNPKKHPEKQIEMLKKSMGEFGFTNPILTSKDDMIIAGHGRMEAAKSIGLTEVPTIMIDLPYEKAVAYVIADNRLAELAEEDSVMLADLLDEIDDDLMEAVGFSQDDLDELLEGIESEMPSEVVEDEAPEVSQSEPVTQRGDIWLLGKHRLMCGDSTDTADVSKLMDGNKADMAFSDPPYNLNFEYNEYDDSKSYDEYKKFCSKWFANLNKFSQGNSIITPGKQNLGMWYEIQRWTEMGVWIAKNKMSGGKVSHLSLFEPVLFYGKFDRTSRASDLFEFNVKQQDDTGDHTCPKIITFIIELVECYSTHGDSWIELFGGLGTTMSACEQTGRTSFNMEFDPHYCDVIIQRYVNLTGDDELTRNGEPYLWRGSDE
jgi:DNA modification methylase